MSEDEKIVLYTSDEAASYKTGIKGWVSRQGHYFGEDEHTARYHGSTHKNCEDCGELIDKMGYCSTCHDKIQDQKYMEMQCRQWDGEAALYSQTNSVYFFDAESIKYYLEETECILENLHLVICEPVSLSTISSDVWCGELAEDGELPDEVKASIDILNAIIMDQQPVSWHPGKYAVDLTSFDSER